MADDNKAEGDVAADQANAPIKPEDLVVRVKPRKENLPSKRHPIEREKAQERNDRKQELADKATDGAAKEVGEAVEKAAPDGREAQKQAAEKAAQGVGKKLPQRIFKEVEVEIRGEDAPIVAPATEGPPPDPPPPKKGI